MTSVALLAGDLLRSLSSPALARFLADWPERLGADATNGGAAASVSGASSAMPVLRFLPDIAADERRVGGALVSAVCSMGRSLAWRQTYTAGELGGEFLRNYGWTEILGPGTPLTSPRIACGLLLLGPATLYPRHRHEAEEIYVPLSGTANWQQGDAIWRERFPGEIVHHASDELHAMHTGTRPLLALYLWRSDDLGQKARLEPPRVT